MEKESRQREYLFIGGGAIIGAVLLTALTLAFWRFFDLDHSARIDPSLMSFTLPKGALLGGATGYVISLMGTERSDLAAKVCLGAGGVVMLVFGAGLDNIRTSMQWDGFTAVWGLALLIFGARTFFVRYKQKAAEHEK